MLNFFRKLLGMKKILVFTLGNDKFPCSPSQLESLKKAIKISGLVENDQDPLVWNHTLKIHEIWL